LAASEVDVAKIKNVRSVAPIKEALEAKYQLALRVQVHTKFRTS